MPKGACCGKEWRQKGREKGTGEFMSFSSEHISCDCGYPLSRGESPPHTKCLWYLHGSKCKNAGAQSPTFQVNQM